MANNEEIQAEVEEDSREADLSSECSTSLSPRADVAFHKVSKHDTLAGLAIKYGVTVFDIKKANGLLSDVAMFGRETLIIPSQQSSKDESSDREALARFVGNLGKKKIEGGWTSNTHLPLAGPSSSTEPLGAQANSGFLSVLHESKPRQEIELREHVGYAGSQSGVEDSLLPERVRRRKRDEGTGEVYGRGQEIPYGPADIGRPPAGPSRSKEFAPLGPSSAPNNGDGYFFGFFKGLSSSSQGESLFEKIKRVANSPALAAPAGGFSIAGSMTRPGSELGSIRQSSFSSVGSGAPKACPKTD
ncbi:hypothetical protein BSKO_00393 [Bryopsis sp. KO-2023]|nr:hypothetical protein BSKO_00393 [Bryopsis sp. KO-2023]